MALYQAQVIELQILYGKDLAMDMNLALLFARRFPFYLVLIKTHFLRFPQRETHYGTLTLSVMVLRHWEEKYLQMGRNFMVGSL